MESRQCFICGRNGRGDRLEKHHIFGAANRKKSEKYGLVVYLCGNRCHRLGKYSCHMNSDVMNYLHRYGQSKFMLEHGCNVEKFVAEFGRNYL